MTIEDSSKKREEARRRRLLDAVRRCAQRDGSVPGLRKFAEEMGEKSHLWLGNLWPSWRAFLLEAGLVAREMTQAVPEDELLAHLAALTREHARFPTSSQLKYAHVRDARFPGEKTFRTRFGGLPEMLDRLREWVGGKPEYADVGSIVATSRVQTRAIASKPNEAVVVSTLLGDSFIPPVVDCLPALAIGDDAIERQCAERGVTSSVELEKRTALAFRILGLDVEGLGQGSGRVADGIARCRQGRWAVVYDAKVRRGGFVMGTEDRKFREYVERHGKELERDGVDAIYFAVVSSSFDEGDLAKAREVVRLTKAKAFVLVEAAALRALVELKLRTSVLDDSERLERLFARSAIVDLETVRAFEEAHQ